MRTTIFDSRAEQEAHERLVSLWSRYVAIYPQIPVRNVLGYSELRDLGLGKRATDYLVRTAFDFVVCELGTNKPLLAIEFDGLGYGFSRRGAYISRRTPHGDPHRRLKLQRKLDACGALGVPCVVVSFPETRTIHESGSAITVLDAIIGQTRASRALEELIDDNRTHLDHAFGADPSGDHAQAFLWELEFRSQTSHNPICRKTLELFRRIPIDPGYNITFLRDRAEEGYVGVRRSISGGVEIRGEIHRHQVLLSASIYLRDIGGSGGLADQIAEYCLAKKAIREVGTEPIAWQRLLNETPWTDSSAASLISHASENGSALVKGV